MPILTHFHMSQQPPRIVKKDVLAKHMHNTALSLSLLTLGHPNISCQSIQEYHHHFYPRMLLDSGDYTVDMGDHLVWAFSCLGNFRFFWVRQYNQSSSPSWKPAELDSGQTRPSSCYLPPSDVGMLNDMSCSQSMLSATQSTVDCLSGNLWTEITGKNSSLLNIMLVDVTPVGYVSQQENRQSLVKVMLVH